MLSVVLFSVVMMSVVMMSVVMLSVVMLSVVMFSVVAPQLKLKMDTDIKNDKKTVSVTSFILVRRHFVNLLPPPPEKGFIDMA